MNEPDLDIDPEEKREELIQDAEQAKAEQERKYADLIDAVKNDEELSHGGTEWVELGDAEFEVHTEMRGDVLDTFDKFNTKDPSEFPSLRELVEAAKKQTKAIRYQDLYMQTDEEIGGFYDAYYDEHGSKVLESAMERILDPAIEGMEQMVPESFQSEQQSGSANRTWDVNRP